MKTIISSITFLLTALASASPLSEEEARQASSPGPYKISNFEASKGHLSGYCRYITYPPRPLTPF